MTKWEYIPPWALQILGVLMLVGATAFWIISGEQSALIIGAAMALIGLGAYSGIRITVHQEIDKAKAEERIAGSTKRYGDEHLHRTTFGEDRYET